MTTELMDLTTVAGQAELAQRVVRIEAKLDRMMEFVERVEHRVEGLEELKEDFVPIANDAFKMLSNKLVELEKRGAVGFVKEGINVMETVATSFSEEDVRLLGENVVHILNTVRALTQPEVLGVAGKAAQALETVGAETEKKKLGLFRAMRDPEVRKGMTVMMAVLRELGSEHQNDTNPARVLETSGAA